MEGADVSHIPATSKENYIYVTLKIILPDSFYGIVSQVKANSALSHHDPLLARVLHVGNQIKTKIKAITEEGT